MTDICGCFFFYFFKKNIKILTILLFFLNQLFIDLTDF